MGNEHRPYPELLSADEQAALLSRSEELWRRLEANDLGGFAGINRPFWILAEFKSVIEQFGHRDVGLKWSKDDLDAASLRTDTPQGEDGITQSDRDAAADWYNYGPNTNARIHAGKADHLALVQAFARHRRQAIADTERRVLRDLPIPIGTKVRAVMTDNDGRGWIYDWQRWEGYVAGVDYDTRKGLNYTVAEEWPPLNGLTDGFAPNQLEPIATSIRSTGDGSNP